MGRVLVAAKDLLTRTRLEEAARAAGNEVETVRRLEEPPPDEPALVLVDLDDADVGAIEPWRARWPELRIVCFVSHIDTARWRAAEALGCEVHPRGATTRAAELLG